MKKYTFCYLLFLLLIMQGLVNPAFARNDEPDERERATILEKALTKLYFYPINRLMDLQDIFHFGIAGSLGLGVEIAITEKASFGGYYVAKETGIAYHGPRRQISWIDAPPPSLNPIKLIPGLNEKQRSHTVQHGYATASFGSKRYESKKNEHLHFKRFTRKAVINELLPTEHELGTQKYELIEHIDEALEKGNETALRAEVVAGIVHPYVAIDIQEMIDMLTGLFLLDLKKDDLQVQPGSQKLRKLGRGMANILTGIMEIPLNVLEVQKDEGSVAALTYGTTRGLWRFFMRSAVVGPWEIMTFPSNTEAVIEPEFLFSTSSSEMDWRVKYK